MTTLLVRQLAKRLGYRDEVVFPGGSPRHAAVCDCSGTGFVRSPVTGSVRRCPRGCTPAYLLPASSGPLSGGMEGTAAASCEDAAAATHTGGVLPHGLSFVNESGDAA